MRTSMLNNSNQSSATAINFKCSGFLIQYVTKDSRLSLLHVKISMSFGFFPSLLGRMLRALFVKFVIHNYHGFHLTMGKKVFEICPSIEWNKGDVLEYLLDTFGFNNSKNDLPFYIGDDRTDEDAFKIWDEYVKLSSQNPCRELWGRVC